ncbi:hypothetical protein [Pasteuria penetrans]|uniref:hypothetical protein n=1 Tax=Pasteuria penetrans TaxID=86005 RepID=UPI00165BF02C|nr:hypothetical protein [Pasteuria penetrans]
MSFPPSPVVCVVDAIPTGGWSSGVGLDVFWGSQVGGLSPFSAVEWGKICLQHGG